MHGIKKVSFYLIHIFNILLFLVPLLLVTMWVCAAYEPVNFLMSKEFIFTPLKTPEGMVNLAHLHLTPFAMLIGLMGSLMGAMPTLLGFWTLKQLFQNYHGGEIFTLQNTQHYRFIGWLFLMDGLLAQPLQEMITTLAVTLSNAPGHRYIAISFGTPNGEAILYGLILIVISWVMAEGHRLKNDAQLTI